jgi:hypothetical protein
MNPLSESDSTIEYYNKNSSEFISRTIDVDTNGDFASAVPRIKALLAVTPKTNH